MDWSGDRLADRLSALHGILSTGGVWLASGIRRGGEVFGVQGGEESFAGVFAALGEGGANRRGQCLFPAELRKEARGTGALPKEQGCAIGLPASGTAQGPGHGWRGFGGGVEVFRMEG